jgi:hypothetical protein
MKERLRWHPDKFERCLESARDQLKTKAIEIFQIIQVLLGDGLVAAIPQQRQALIADCVKRLGCLLLSRLAASKRTLLQP